MRGASDHAKLNLTDWMKYKMDISELVNRVCKSLLEHGNGSMARGILASAHENAKHHGRGYIRITFDVADATDGRWTFDHLMKGITYIKADEATDDLREILASYHTINECILCVSARNKDDIATITKRLVRSNKTTV